MKDRCSFCEGLQDGDNMYLLHSFGSYTLQITNKNHLRLWWRNEKGIVESDGYGITYCPMCGRKLIEESESK